MSRRGQRVSTSAPQPEDGMFCAPGINGSKGTCFDRAGLLRIIGKYNDYYGHYADNRIAYNKSDTNDILWKKIRNGLANACKDQESCWLDQDFLKNDTIIGGYYRPPKPKGQTQWLSTNDIDGVLKQYEAKYPDFAFMGTVPIDFDQVIEEYKNIDVCMLHGGKRGGMNIDRYGFVFNLDPHDQKGSHWVCMFMNLKDDQRYIGFFDSYGGPPPKQIKVLISRLKAQVKNCLGIDLVFKINTVQHQHKNTECGVYCLYFIYQCLQGHSFENITRTIILDDAVNKFRDYFFRPQKTSN